METPSSSSREILRSEALGMAANSRSALIDITNDSPIVGLAIGSSKTPSSTFSTKRTFIKNSDSKEPTTPRSGETLLRCQVKTLLQKVEEEAVISKISFEPRYTIREQGDFVNSPNHLLAPTPANTPHISAFSGNSVSESSTISPVVGESFKFSQMLDQQEVNDETLEKNLITKFLFTDFPEEFEGFDSFLNYEDDESAWSVQVNVSTSDEGLEDMKNLVENMKMMNRLGQFK